MICARSLRNWIKKKAIEKSRNVIENNQDKAITRHMQLLYQFEEANMDIKRLKILIEEGESMIVEFKEKYTPKIDEDIVAFANTKGGIIILGVGDSKTIVGEKLTNDLKAKINSLARNINASISVTSSQIDNLVVIEVQEGNEKPYSCSTGYFRRLDGSTQKMNHEEIRAMFSKYDAVPFEEKLQEDCSLQDISREKIQAFIKEANLNLGNISSIDFLKSLKVADDKKIKNAAVLFFAKDPTEFISQAQMTLLAFKGTDKVDIYDRHDIKDDLLTQFNEAILFIQKHLNRRSEIKGVNRKDIYEIPLEPLREAVANALMHRDYNVRGTSVNVEIFDDRVEIVNPGGITFPKADFGKISVRRNEIISDLFSRMDKCERAGSGIKRMRNEMLNAGLEKPKFEVTSFFRAIFYRPGKVGETHQITPHITTHKLATALEIDLLNLIHQNPHITRKQIANTLKLSSETIKEYLSKLKNKKLLTRIGPDKGGYWKIIEK